MNAEDRGQAASRSEVHGVCPMDCPDTCSWTVNVEEGRATKLSASRDHPHTRGALCVKLNRYLEHTRAKDRLLYPLRRVGEKGEGRFERIGWEEALDEISRRWQQAIARHGPQAIWPYYGCGTLGMLQGTGGAGRRLANALGTSQHHMSICMVAGATGTGYVLGDNRVGMDPETFAESGLILLWGANPLTTGHHLWKFISAARKKGAYLVAIGLVRTRSAERADEHFAPVPGTDAALALGLMYCVVSAEVEDREFILKHTLARRCSGSASSSFRRIGSRRSPASRRSGYALWASGWPRRARGPSLRRWSRIRAGLPLPLSTAETHTFASMTTLKV